MLGREYETDELLSHLRNPHGLSHDEMKKSRLAAADEIELWRDGYLNLKAWCEQNGLDTATYHPGPPEGWTPFNSAAGQ